MHYNKLADEDKALITTISQLKKRETALRAQGTVVIAKQESISQQPSVLKLDFRDVIEWNDIIVKTDSASDEMYTATYKGMGDLGEHGVPILDLDRVSGFLSSVKFEKDDSAFSIEIIRYPDYPVEESK